LAAVDERVRVEVNPTNLGPVGNLRRCLELARGTYVKFLMSDDRLRPIAVATLLAAMQVDPSVVFATSSRGQIDSSGAPLPGLWLPAPITGNQLIEGRDLGNLAFTYLTNFIGEPTTVLFRRDAVDPGTAFTFAGRQYRWYADLAMWLTILATGRAVYLSQPLSDIRIHPHQDQRTPAAAIDSVVEWWDLLRDARVLGYLTDDQQWGSVVATFIRCAFATSQREGPQRSASLFSAISESAAALQELASRQIVGGPEELAICPRT
jgi:glycosyltransferase involved in cell wall biosynthesis